MRSHVSAQIARKVLLGAVLAASALAFVSLPAHAQSAICLRLVNNLAAIDSGGGFASPSPRYQQYARAVNEQEAQIAKTRRAAQFNGCDSIFGRGRPVCARIDASLNQMYANLSELKQTRDRLSGSGGENSARRNAILREMRRYGCEMRSGGSETQASNQRPQRRSLLEQIFGIRTYNDYGQRSNNAYDPDTGLASRYGTYRTLCVRKCDGYYFPISFSTVRERFEQDDLTCQSMCPGTDVELFIHGMPDQESEDMISYRTGEPYRQLSTAFDYRKQYNSECTCRFSSGYLAESSGAVGGENQSRARMSFGQQIPLPEFKNDPGLDPETLANLEGGLTAGDVDALSGEEEKPERPVASASGKIRVVGPEFFPVQ
ncbi:MAG: DUF2865 domain-containing protein [Nitratireductor sp.]|nr:DUF2865 domain-containing protein [Nitratireductor sp.]